MRSLGHQSAPTFFVWLAPNWSISTEKEEDAAADEDISAWAAPIVKLEEVAVTPAKKTNFDPIFDLRISSLTPLPTLKSKDLKTLDSLHDHDCRMAILDL
ncbi:hypothetical protein CRG98_000486 [Punica granatum]|uniref:Uncharacterized protein n=1 Tax=Punica granatum TaxID=22663 RepID=A0A2I0LET8_PUNGR|nr:hypothetical protein CRG98_000486 [Punica granatum]